jgi:hypothetical protein
VCNPCSAHRLQVVSQLLAAMAGKQTDAPAAPLDAGFQGSNCSVPVDLQSRQDDFARADGLDLDSQMRCIAVFMRRGSRVHRQVKKTRSERPLGLRGPKLHGFAHHA